ncbi:NepR family anti-sigma factor [Roseovarius tibetensis]|uniref:NepR family anti-sigma factor n=1 Tax=Roseovarius tibetensis TaxID=2685897 RepID=UPI003D7F92F2
MPEQDPKNTDGPGDRSDRTSDIDQQISENLRKLYQSTIDEELPQSLRDLLDRLKAQDDDDD